MAQARWNGQEWTIVALSNRIAKKTGAALYRPPRFRYLEMDLSIFNRHRRHQIFRPRQDALTRLLFRLLPDTGCRVWPTVQP